MNPYIIIKPVITEKSVRLAQLDSTFTFVVRTISTKNQIQEAVEKLFNVQVQKIRTIVNQKEVRRTGKKRLSTSVAKTKKALVTLKEGHTIDLFDVAQAQ